MEQLTKIYFGVDVGSQTLVISEGITTPYTKFSKLKTLTISNDESSINEWINTLPITAHIIFEYTGTYSLPLTYGLELADVVFTAINPTQSKAYAQVLNVSNQNDEIDASLLAIYGINQQPNPTQLENESLHQLKQKRKHLASLMAQKQVLDSQLHALSFDARADKKVVNSKKILQTTFELEIQQFKDDIFTLNQEQYQKIYDLMTTIVGIGDATANAIIVATNGFENFSNAKQVIKLIGLAPQDKTSGKSVNKNKGIPKVGLGFVRSCLYNAAKSAKRWNNTCKELYENLRSRGKAHKVAMVAVMAKLIKQAFAVVKSQKPFDNFYQVAK